MGEEPKSEMVIPFFHCININIHVVYAHDGIFIFIFCFFGGFFDHSINGLLIILKNADYDDCLCAHRPQTRKIEN